MRAIEFVRKYRITGEIIDGPNTSSDGGWEHYAMQVRLSLTTGVGEIRHFEMSFMAGVAWSMPEFTGDSDTLPAKSVGEIIGSLADNLRSRDKSWGEYASDFHPGDPNDLTVREHNTWEEVIAQGRKVADWLYSQAMLDDMESVVE